LRHNGAYWAHIDTILDAGKPARIEAETLDDGTVRVITSNLVRFHLDLACELVGPGKDVTVTIDGTPVRAAAGGTVNFAQTSGAWGVSAERFPAGLVKKPGSSGPIMDVFMGERVLFVYGTRLEKDPAERGKMVDAVVTTLFGKPDGDLCFHAAFPRKADVDVTPADMASSHLVLLGTPAQNSLVARIASSMSLQFTDTGVKAGAKEYKGAGLMMVYPNPLNPERYVLLMPEDYHYAAPDPRALHDYLIGTFGDRTHVLAEGTFDTRWQLPQVK